MIMTEIIEPSGGAGDLSEHFVDKAGKQRKLYCQVVVYFLNKGEENPVWTDQELNHRYVYNCFDPEEKINKDNVNLFYFDNRDMDIFQLTITAKNKKYLTIRDLKEMKFPEGAKDE